MVTPIAADESAGLAAIVQSIWARDPAIWTDDPLQQQTLRHLLGWLEVAANMRRSAIEELTGFADEVRRAGFTHALLLGMGGSSLAPEVLRLTYGVRPGFLDLAVLDSTDPSSVLDWQRRLPPEKTLYIVSTKSGTTTETLCFQRFFYEHARQEGARRAAAGRAEDPEGVGRQFVAITDPGTPLETLAAELGFRRTFLNPPDIGGRFSALSYFGLVPAALLGIDLRALLDRATDAMRECSPETPLAQNKGAQLGAALARHADAGRDKVTLVLPHPFQSLGSWVEQLLAESTGKDGRGLVPIEGEALGPPEVYGPDRIFVTLDVTLDPAQGEGLRHVDGKSPLQALEAAEHPVMHLPAERPVDLGYQFFIWEFATAVAGALLRIEPFEQPNVQESKDNTNRVLADYQAAGHLPVVPEMLPGETGVQALSDLLRQASEGDYLALLAYVPRTPEVETALGAWRLALRDHLKLATTVGFGPRFLHSTGQLHKGGPNTGVFVQLVSDDAEDALIPGQTYSFSTLKHAQAIGDLQALQTHARPVVRVRLQGDLARAIRALATETVPLFPMWEAGQQRA